MCAQNSKILFFKNNDKTQLEAYSTEINIETAAFCQALQDNIKLTLIEIIVDKTSSCPSLFLISLLFQNYAS